MKYFLKCLRQYADFKGRARKKEFWFFLLYSFIFSILVRLIDGVIGTYDPQIGLGLLGGLYSLGIMIPYWAVWVRRLHDVGKSVWWIFILFIPLIGAIWLLILFVRDSQEGENQYGPNPKTDTLE